jgi:MSHA pilin protein MshC
MRVSYSQIEAIEQHAGRNVCAATQVRLSGSRPGENQRGFTLIEMIMVMVIVGILAAVVAPRFLGTSVFQSRGFADQVQATLRYAQKEAIAQRSLVCVTLTSASVTLAIASSSAAVVCTLPLVLPAGGSSITAPPGVTFASYTSANFNFDALGRTATRQTIVVNGASNNIIVEAETGYVHSP